ncbi:MmcQ/YjbR family DNA-binding protein [soil metagenome]
MTPAQFEAFCLGLPGATLSIQWGDDRVYKVGGKMFAVGGGAVGAGGFSLKTSDIAFEVLTENGPGRPAPYLARAKWVAFPGVDAIPDEDIQNLVTHAHAIVAAKLTKAARREAGLPV